MKLHHFFQLSFKEAVFIKHQFFITFICLMGVLPWQSVFVFVTLELSIFAVSRQPSAL